MPHVTPSARRYARPATLFAVGLTMSAALTLSSGPGGASAAAEGNVRLSPPMSTVAAGEGPFTVYVVLEELHHDGSVNYDDNRDGVPDRSIPSAGLGAFQFTIEYDAAVVEFQDAERGPSLSSTGRSFQCLPAKIDPGSITFGCLSPGSNPEGPQGNLTLASVQFAPRGSGLSPLVLSAEVAGPLGDSAEVDVGGGAVRVEGETQAVPTDPSNNDTTATSTRPAGTGATIPATGGTSGPNGTPATPGTPGTAVASGTSSASGTPEPTVTQDPPGPGEEDSGSNWWLWLLGGGVIATLGAGGLMAFLARRGA